MKTFSYRCGANKPGEVVVQLSNLLHFTVVAHLFLVPFGTAADEPPKRPASENEQTFQKLETQWNEAHVRGDAESLGRLWAEELVVTVQEMPVMNREQSLKIVSSGRVKFKRYETSDVKVNVLGDAAVVTGRVKRVREKQGGDVEDDWRFTKVYVRREGHWQVVAWHGSQSAK
jgi:ketosteroid isomerase-like protein